MFKRTKIICTIGPAVDSFEKIVQLMESGMDVARLNLSHGEKEEHTNRINWVKKAREMLERPCAIMLDTKGPEVRVGTIEGGSISLSANDVITLTATSKDKNQIEIHPFSVLDNIAVGMKVLFDDGYIISKVIAKSDAGVEVEIQNGGKLSSRKGVNIPNAHLNLPAMTDQDVEDIKFGCDQDVDFIAASFIRSSDHVLQIKNLLAEQGRPDILVIAKIENAQGVENFDTIVRISDGIMVARGDLGVELDLGVIPKLQKMMIRRCFDACKPAVTATQMLESMITNPRPTRAEVSDVANAIYDGSSVVMLSGETAVGKYPIETVQRMQSIIDEAEKDYDYKEFFFHHARKDFHNVSSAVSSAAVKTAYSVDAKAIFAFTASGFTAHQVSRLRPFMPIMAVTGNWKIYHQLAFAWGVIPIFKQTKNKQEAFAAAMSFSLKNGFLSFGDLVIVTSGSEFGKTGSTNTMMVENIGDVLLRGGKGHGPKLEKNVIILFGTEDVDLESLKDKIVVIPRCDNSYLPLMKEVAGIILDNNIDDSASEKYAILVAKTFDLSIIVRAEGAMTALRNKETVTLDPGRGVVYLSTKENS